MNIGIFPTLYYFQAHHADLFPKFPPKVRMRNLNDCLLDEGSDAEAPGVMTVGGLGGLEKAMLKARRRTETNEVGRGWGWG